MPDSPSHLRQGASPTLHINTGPGPVKVLRTLDDGVRWCFQCRAHLHHDAEVLAYDCNPLDDWYGPWMEIRCRRCGEDHTEFPS